MKYFYRTILALLLAFSTTTTAESNRKNDLKRVKDICIELQNDLNKFGFENIMVMSDSSRSINIAYENRLYRDDMTALSKVLYFASSCGAQAKNIIIIIKQINVNVIALQLKPEELQQFLAHEIGERDFGERIRFVSTDKIHPDLRRFSGQELSHASFRKIDIEMQPIFTSNLGNRDDPFKVKLDLELAAKGHLTQGLSFYASSRIPIANEIDAHRGSVRLYSGILNYLTRLGSHTFVSANIGYFSGERYGFSAQTARFFRHGNIGLSARLDYTGFLFHDEGKWFYSNLDLLTYNLGAYWQFSGYGFRAAIQYGKYLRGDTGTRVTLGRYFRETRFDFFAIATTDDRWLGAELRLPLFPNKRFRPRRLRVNLPESYQIKYDYKATGSGETFEIAHDLNEFRSGLTQNYILNNLAKLRSPQK